MRKISPKEQSQRLHAFAVRGVLALVVACLLAAPIAVQAELQATRLAYSWDITANEFEWGHVTIEWDGSWIPLLQEVYFDQLDRPSDDPNDPLPCADPNETTRYAGWIEYGLPFLDNDPEGARGFQASQNWTLIDCDLNQDGIWDEDDDLLVGPQVLNVAKVLAECTTDEGAYCQILPNPDPATNVEHRWLWDLEQDCVGELSEHCDREIATRLWINIDPDCDQAVDDDFLDPETGQLEPICVYSDVLTPDYEAGEAIWAFPLGVRISDKNGAKTLMLYPDPTAVELATFDAMPEGNRVLLSWETASEIDNLGFNIYRAESRVGQLIKINPHVIASQNLGSAMGAAYSFVDESVVPGATYYYWLEDINASGGATKHGPVAARAGAGRALPGRPRPAPMPAGQFE